MPISVIWRWLWSIWRSSALNNSSSRAPGDRVTCKRLQRELEKTRKRIEQKREAGRSRQSREGKIAPCKVEKNSPGQNTGFDANSLKDNESASAHAEPPQQRTPQRSASETLGTQDSGIEREAKTQNQVKEIVPSPTGDGTSSMPLGNGMKTLRQRKQELEQKANEPFDRAEALVKDAEDYAKSEHIIGARARAIGKAVEIKKMDRSITVTALPDGKWGQADAKELDHDDMLDLVRGFLDARQ